MICPNCHESYVELRSDTLGMKTTHGGKCHTCEATIDFDRDQNGKITNNLSRDKSGNLLKI